MSDQLIQKHTRLTQRLMNKLSGFFRPSPVNSRIRSASQLSTAGEETDRSSLVTPPSRGIFSRMLSREEVSGKMDYDSINCCRWFASHLYGEETFRYIQVTSEFVSPDPNHIAGHQVYLIECQLPHRPRA